MRKNYTCKIYKNGKVASRVSSHSIRRFLRNLRTISFSKDIEKVHLKISYERGEQNEDYFKNTYDLTQAFWAFDEIGREKGEKNGRN